MNLNHCKGSTITRLHEYTFANNNLYLVSEAHDFKLLSEQIPRLQQLNEENIFVVLALVNDLVKVNKNWY